MAGGGAPATGTGGGQTVFTPPNQGTAAFNFGNILQPFIDSSFTAANNLAGFQGGGFPESYVVPNAFQSTQNIVQNPYAGGALTGATNAQDVFQNQTLPYIFAAAPQLEGIANIAAAQTPGVVGNTYGNPAYQQAADLGTQYGTGLPALGAQYGAAEAAAGQQAGSPLLQSEQQLLNLGFDPQQALYNQSRGQTLDAANVANAMSGTANTPYGASVLGNTLGNFDINWQNQAQARANAGAQAAGAAGATGLSDLTTGYGTGLNLAGTGLQAGQSSLLTPANNRTAAFLQGTSGLGNLASTAGSAYAAPVNLTNQAAQGYSTYGQLPYQTYQGIQGNNLSALANLTGLTNQQYQLPQQTLQDLESYLNLGQSASTIANQIGATNFNEQLAGLSGIGSGIGLGNSLLGNPLGKVGSSALSGLGGGGFAASAAANPGVFTTDAAGAITDAAGGADFSSFAPLAFLGS